MNAEKRVFFSYFMPFSTHIISFLFKNFPHYSLCYVIYDGWKLLEYAILTHFYVPMHRELRLDGAKGDFADPLWRHKTGHFKVHIFWEGHKILQNLHRRFDWHYSQVSIKQAACLTTYVHMYYFFCCISQWLKTKCQISLFWFLLLSYNLKRKKSQNVPSFFELWQKIKQRKLLFGF